MSADNIFIFAILVYLLMVAGMFFTMWEFNRLSDEPSERKSELPKASE
jgi:hypothetical protein